MDKIEKFEHDPWWKWKPYFGGSREYGYLWFGWWLITWYPGEFPHEFNIAFEPD